MSARVPVRTATTTRHRTRLGSGLIGLCWLLLAGTGLLSGCSNDTEADTATGRRATQAPGAPADLPKGWTYVAGKANSTDDPGDPKLPAKITDGTGTKVTVHDISKIIVAGDGVAAILGALGLQDKIYGAPTDAVSPEAEAAPKKFAFNKSTGAEGLLAVDGTLFIGDNILRHGSVAQQFRAAGTDAFVVDDQASLGDKIKTVAGAVGLQAQGVQLAEQVDDQLAEAKKSGARREGGRLNIVEVTATGAGGRSSVAGLGTPGTQMIETIGASSVGAAAKLRGYSVEMSNEGMLAGAPDVIVLTVADLKKWGDADAMWRAFPTLQQTPAGKANRVYVMPDAQLKYPSPEIGVGAQALAEAVAGVTS